MEDYISLAINSALATGTYVNLLSLFLLTLARLTPIIVLSPFFGSKILPHPVKVTLAISLFAIFLPQLLVSTTMELGLNPRLILLMVKEVTAGLFIGFLMGLPFLIIQNAGIIIDHQRGGASLMVNDPTTQNQASPLGKLYNLTFIYIFFLINGPIMFIEVISDSFAILPVDQMFSHLFFHPESNFWQTILPMYNKIMILSIQFASPGLIMILMTDVFLGIANRLAPQVQITFLGLPLKSLLAFTVVTFGWKMFTNHLPHFSQEWLLLVKNIVQMFRIGL